MNVTMQEIDDFLESKLGQAIKAMGVADARGLAIKALTQRKCQDGLMLISHDLQQVKGLPIDNAILVELALKSVLVLQNYYFLPRKESIARAVEALKLVVERWTESEMLVKPVDRPIEALVRVRTRLATLTVNHEHEIYQKIALAALWPLTLRGATAHVRLRELNLWLDEFVRKHGR